MDKKIAILLIIFSISSIKLYSQLNATSGTMTTFGNKPITEPIFFFRETSDINNTTKYTITLDGADIYEIGFKMYKKQDSLLMYLFDKRTFQAASRYWKVNKQDSFIIIRNDQLHDTAVQIKYKDYQTLLISIPDQKEPYVYLHEIKTLNSQEEYITLSPLQPQVLERHLKATDEYWRRKRAADEIKRKKDSTLMALTEEVVSDSKREITKINSDAAVLCKVPASVNAEQPLQVEFNQQMDSIFNSCLKSVNNDFKADEMSVGFDFSCDCNNKINPSQVTPYYKNGKGLLWFTDSFNLKIKPVIYAGSYKTNTKLIERKQLKSVFESKFLSKFQDLANNDKIYKDSLKQFSDTLQKISLNFNPYLNQTINDPTRYNYNFKYKTEITESEWRFKDTTVKLRDGATIDNKQLVALFKQKVAVPGKTKYPVEICTIYINDKMVGQDIREAPKK